MEYSQTRDRNGHEVAICVLILILMEYSQTENTPEGYEFWFNRLNPYSNGILTNISVTIS